jgi:hypothetical protein
MVPTLTISILFFQGIRIQLNNSQEQPLAFTDCWASSSLVNYFVTFFNPGNISSDVHQGQLKSEINSDMTRKFEPTTNAHV